MRSIGIRRWGILLVLWMFGFPAMSLQERHIIFIRQGGVQALTPLGKEQIRQTGEVLVTYGFDNRSIAAVYTMNEKGSMHCAKVLSEFGLYTPQKIHKIDNMSLNWYDQIEKKHHKGHVVVIDDNTRSADLIEAVAGHAVERQTTQPYIVPFAPRKVL